MISTTGKEPASVNTELSWKTKGLRSGTRRPRKINQWLNMGFQHNDEGIKEEPSVADSDKFGVAFPGNRFSENIDHLPIKKRRLLQQSLPPPPPPPRIPFDQLNVDLGQETKSLDDLVSVITSRDAISYLNERTPCLDSYGIELLAAAACNTSIDKDIHNVKAVKFEKNYEALHLSGLSIHATLLEENNRDSKKERSLLKDFKLEDHAADYGKQNKYPVVSVDVQNDNDSEAGKGSSTAKELRLHWDLNTLMYEEEQNKYPVVSDDVQNNKDSEAGKGSSSAKELRFHWDLNTLMYEEEQNKYPVVSDDVQNNNDSEVGKGSSSAKELRLHWDLNTSMDEWELPPGNTCTSPLNCPSETDGSAQVISKLKCPDKGLSSRLDRILSESPLLEKLNTPITMMSAKVEDPFISSDLQLGQALTLENEKQGIAMVDPTISEHIVCNVVRSRLDKDKISDLPNNRNPSFAKDRELAEKKDLNISSTDGAPADSLSEVEVKKVEQKRYHRLHEDSLDDGDVSDYSPSRHHHLLTIENMSKDQSGYESPMEDGELRESFVHSWQENEGETDCLDYDASGKHDSPKESSHSVTTGYSPGRIQIYEDCEHVKTVGENNVKLGELGAFDSRVKGSLEEKVVSGEKGWTLSMLRQGFSGSRAFDGTKGPRNVQRSSEDCFRDGQVYRTNKFERDGDVSGKWGSRNHYQRGYRRGGSNPGRRSHNSPGANDDQLTYDYQRQSRNNYTKGGYPLDKRRPPNDNHNSIKRDNFATRGDRSYRGRGRSGFYRQGYAKDKLNESHGHISKNSAPFYNRDSSFSHSERNSPSRSRTRSPVPWHLQRERNEGPKRMSRSPNFRSEGRMGRNRMHFGDSNYSENEDGFLSSPRKRFYDQNSGPTHFRERKSPGRFFGQRQRFGSNGSAGRMKTDDGGFRPRLNSERFSKQSRGSWRGRNNKFNNNYDGIDSGRRSNNKHEMVRQVRCSDTGDAGKLFRSDANDYFEDHDDRSEFNNETSSIRSPNNKNSRIKSTEKSDVPGIEKLWEREEGQLMDDDVTSSKLPELQGCEDVGQ